MNRSGAPTSALASLAPVTRYQWLTVTTVLATLALIAVGALVRTTGSGLGCPDWPLCHGQWIPPAERTAIIEYSHRTVAAVVGVLIVATSLATLRIRRNDRTARIIAIAIIPLLGAQALFGREAVIRELPAEVVTIHLATALLLLSMLGALAAFAYLGEERVRVESEERRRFLRIAAIAAAVTAVVLLLGSYVVGSGATTACTTWPGCQQAPIPFLDGARLQHIHWLHRITVLFGLGAVAIVAFAATNLREPSDGVRLGAWAVVVLYGAQILVGALNIFTKFSTAILVAHLAFAAAIWAVLAVTVVAGRYRPQPAQVREVAPRPGTQPRPLRSP